MANPSISRRLLRLPRLIVVALLAIVAWVFVYPALSPNALDGDVIDFILMPKKGAPPELWILTDDSFKYLFSKSTPGHFEQGPSCFLCKARLYQYDPFARSTRHQFRIDHDDVIIRSNLSHVDNKVCYVADAYGEDNPKVMVWNADTSSLVHDTAGIVARFPELRSGLARAAYDSSTGGLLLDTKDGQTKLLYSVREDKLYASSEAHAEAHPEDADSMVKRFVLFSEGMSQPRRYLHHVVSSRRVLRQVRAGGIWTQMNLRSLKHYDEHPAVRRLSEQPFLEGLIYHQDDELAIVVHVDQVGKRANRLVSCVDVEGRTRWTLSPDELFDEMRIDEEDDALSAMFFSHDKIHIARSGNLVVLFFKNEGLMGFDATSGKKLFEIE